MSKKLHDFSTKAMIGVLSAILMISSCSKKASSDSAVSFEFVEGLKSFTVDEGKTLSFKVEVSSPDGETITFGKPDIIAIGRSSFKASELVTTFTSGENFANFKMQPNFKQAGDYKAVFSITGSDESQEPLTYTVSIQFLSPL